MEIENSYTRSLCMTKSLNERDSSKLDTRARFFGRVFNWKSPAMEHSFAATPPCESLKFILSRCQTRRRGVHNVKAMGIGRFLCWTYPEHNSTRKCRRELFIRLQVDG